MSLGQDEDPPPLELPSPRAALEQAVTLDPPSLPSDPRVPSDLEGDTEPAQATLGQILAELRALREHVDQRFETVANSMLELREADRKDVEAAARMVSGEVQETRRELLREISLTRQELHTRSDGIEVKLDDLSQKLFGVGESAMSAHDAIGKLTKVVGATYNVAVNAEPHDEPDERAEAGQ